VIAGFVRDQPIRRKLTRIIALALIFGLLLAAAAVTVYDITTFRPRMRRDAESQAALMRAVSTPALQFNDRTTAHDNLGTLEARPEIAAAALYDSTGMEFASYVREGATPPERPSEFAAQQRIDGGHLDLVEPIVVDRQILGWITLRYDLRPLASRIAQYGLIALVVVLALLAVGGLLMRVLDRTVTAPLRELSEAARGIERTGDVAVRVPYREGDEIGALSDAFNRMLSRLEEQRGTLQTSEERLRLAFEAATMEPWALESGPDALAALTARVHADDRARVRAEVSRAMQEGTLEVEFRSDDGEEERWVALTGQAQRNAQGQVTSLVGVSQDITRRRRLELQLIQSQKMEAIGTLAGGIAHDFNNLLTGVIGYLGFAQRALPNPSPVREDLQQAESAARRAAELTARLLSYARRQMVSPSAANLNEAVTAVEPLLRRILGEHITITTELADDLWRTKVDRTQLEQVLVNLAVNARDAMPQGGTLCFATRNVSVDAHAAATEPELKPGAYVVVDVQDGGVGMDSKTMKRIFEPFFTTKPVGQGTGLGLSMCFGIVKQAGGHILVESRVGRGTRVSVLLPRLVESADDATADPQAPRLELERGSELVLIVEDDAVVRALAGRTLRAAGYRVLEAGGLAEAELAAAKVKAIDLLLSDVVMPGDSGPAVANAIRRRHPAVMVLYMSGYTSDAIAPPHVGSGEPFLPKPFTPAGLAQAVRTVLDGRTAATSA
jgi:signal transduction histidine kinase/ActR/RegA family two-component response regulator